MTGSSGAGKSTALAAFEDAGFYCIDNMPVVLVDSFLREYGTQPNAEAGLVFGMDLRDKNFSSHFEAMLQRLKSAQYNVQIVFLDAEKKILLQRFNQTRRHHPLKAAYNLTDAITSEKQQLLSIKAKAKHIIDTTQLSVHQLKFTILQIAQQYGVCSNMIINIVSFGFKYGPPMQADLMMDVRFLDNPYFIADLKSKDGEAPEVVKFVLQSAHSETFLKKYKELLDFLVPLYEKEGKAYLTIAIGCTGGQHRSVVIASTLHDHLSHKYTNVRLIHRDLPHK